MSFNVLVVCTGNICRSPLAERLLASRLSGYPMTFSSAGTNGLTGHGMDAPSAQALRELGGDPDGHEARRLTGALAAAQDLVLTADLAHRSTVVREEPMLFRRAFTLREFARLGAELDPLAGPVDEDALRRRVIEVAEQRGWVEPAEPGGDDIPDPFGAGLEEARATAALLSDAVDGVARALGLTTRVAQP